MTGSKRALPAVATDDAVRARITARLRALLSVVGQPQQTGDGAVAVAQEIDSASMMSCSSISTRRPTRHPVRSGSASGEGDVEGTEDDV